MFNRALFWIKEAYFVTTISYSCKWFTVADECISQCSVNTAIQCFQTKVVYFFTTITYSCISIIMVCIESKEACFVTTIGYSCKWGFTVADECICQCINAVWMIPCSVFKSRLLTFYDLNLQLYQFNRALFWIKGSLLYYDHKLQL